MNLGSTDSEPEPVARTRRGSGRAPRRGTDCQCHGAGLRSRGRPAPGRPRYGDHWQCVPRPRLAGSHRHESRVTVAVPGRPSPPARAARALSFHWPHSRRPGSTLEYWLPPAPAIPSQVTLLSPAGPSRTGNRSSHKLLCLDSDLSRDHWAARPARPPQW